jgi:superfamily II DNA or RNA helicase
MGETVDRSAPLTLSAPLEWDASDPWTFTMAISGGQAEDGYVIDGWLARGGERMALTDPVLVLADGIVLTQTHAARLDVGTSFAWLAAMRGDGRIAVPLEARDDLLDLLVTSSPSPTLAVVPDDLRVDIAIGRPSPGLRLFPIPSRPDRVRAELAFDYEGTPVPLESPQPIIRPRGSTRAIRRDLEDERRALELLQQHGCRRDWSYGTPEQTLQLPSQSVPRLVRHLLDEGWRIEAEGHLYRQPGAIAISVRSGIDWFELHGHVDYGDLHASLPALLAALDRGETFVTLDDGTRGLLPEEWLRRHALVARLGSASGDHLRFRKAQVALLDALIAALPEASWDETFTRARAQLKAFDGIQPLDPPDAFVGTLRGYQREGLGWLVFLERFGFGGCLADDMGLGKTVMVLALLCTRTSDQPEGRAPSLVVAPRSVVFNWRQEALRFAPGLRVLEYVGGGRTAMRAALHDYDVVLTTYGTLRRDAAVLSSVQFDYVVLDEAQAVKNAASVSAKATRVLNGRHRLALSGTPIENHLGELWSLFEFLNPGLLSTSTMFGRAGTGQTLDDETIALLARALRPFILRRTKEQVASDLPAKTEQTLYCELERPQRALYDELRAHYRRTLLDQGSGRNGFARAKLQVLEALLRLRQAACHPGLLDSRRTDEPSAKLDVLVPRLCEAIDEGHKVLVFSQFTSLLTILRHRLDAQGISYEYLDGRTRDRETPVERFQSDPTCRLFLVSLKAGGLGLNLTAAEYVFLLDPWWNPAVEAQAVDRAHRIGQSRHVFAYRLIARDTVEERVLELQQQKRQLADAILAADNSLVRNLRREDLELLLS